MAMNCKKIQEFIITDYIDGQMGDKQKSLIDQHLVHCHACKGYLDSIKNEVVNPFVNAPKDVPDEFLWPRIKQTMEEQQHVGKSFIPDFWERLRSAVHIPRPAFALATVATLIFVVGTTGQLMVNSQMMKIKGQEQVEYLSSLIDEPVEIAANNGNDFGTPIEKYFL
jgi:predicted anti-sigma-YlaC factor YlaD